LARIFHDAFCAQQVADGVTPRPLWHKLCETRRDATLAGILAMPNEINRLSDARSIQTAS